MSERTHPESATTAESLKGNGEIILVVDDEATVLRVTVIVLKKQNYRVLCANALVGGWAKIISSRNKGTTIEVSLPLTFRPERQGRQIGR